MGLLDQREHDATQCKGAEARLLGGTAARTSSSVHTTRGMLSAKIQRHVSWSTIQPPASGPRIAAIPPQAVHDPIAAPRYLGPKAATMIASEDGVTSAAAAPWKARAAMSTPIVGASAHATE